MTPMPSDVSRLYLAIKAATTLALMVMLATSSTGGRQSEPPRPDTAFCVVGVTTMPTTCVVTSVGK